MLNVTYLNSATNQTYNPDAFAWIASKKQKNAILDTATKLGVSAGAIAGAMAEECTSYLADYRKQWSVDQIALKHNMGLGSYRTHKEFKDDYTWVKAHNGLDGGGRKYKLDHPVQIDLGQGNFRLSTAITLLLSYLGNHPTDTDDPLRLKIYVNAYDDLAADLVNPDSDATAKFFGLMMQKAEEFYKNNGAYGGQWDSLPQTFRDALLVTYVNRGEKDLTDKKKELYTDKGLPYEPQPGLTVSAGMNHLRNAVTIGNELGLSGYGSDVSGVSELGSQALNPGAAGLAARYALKQLHYVAVEGIDYSAMNANGELDLFNPATNKGSLSSEWIADRSAMLGWFVKVNIEQEISAHKNQFLITDNSITDDGWLFDDRITNKKIEVRSPWIASHNAHKAVFGGEKKDAIEGGLNTDRLYGGGGNDVIKGYDGKDYIEDSGDSI